jgi:predicted transglutaminase-like cysteine proteinase
MTWTIRTAVAVALAIVSSSYAAQAAFFSFPRALNPSLDKIRFETPTLAPIAYTRFCLQYPDDCRTHTVIFRRPRPVVLTSARLKDLIEVNRDVNRAIAPQEDAGTLLDERWIVGPKAGACHDYAVTKRHELLTRGWPSRSLLLAEVVVPWGEHHLILVVRTNDGDLVLDNLSAGIKTWSRTPYKWVRVQSPGDPNIWSTIARSPLPDRRAPNLADSISLLHGAAAALSKS